MKSFPYILQGSHWLLWTKENFDTMNKFTCRLLLVPTNIIFPKRTVLVFTESWSRGQFSTWLLSILFQLADQILIIIKNVEAAGWKYKLHERFWGKNLPSDKKYVYTMSASKIGNDIITVVRSAAAVSAQFIKSSLNPNLHSFLFPWSPKLFSGSLNP